MPSAKLNLYWLVFWNGHKHHARPHKAATRPLALRHGWEKEPDLTLVAVISNGMELPVPQRLELAEVLPPLLDHRSGNRRLNKKP